VIPRAAALVAVAALSLVAASGAGAARFAIGLAPSADRSAVVEQLRERGATRVEDLAPIRALAVTAPRIAAIRGVPGVRYVERLGFRRAAYVPDDPLFVKQWYAVQNRSFDAWADPPPLAAVRVAVIDSGVDGTHPELKGRIAAARSFVPGSALVDAEGHGTFVAGLIAAQTNDAVGMAGLAPPAELLVAKVVGAEGSIPVEAEAKAIRWAVAHGARVINMSLGGLRDPSDPARDTYSRLEADAVAYAVSKGVLVVAAVGNSDQSPSQPWPYASWPAALPHVLGVSALSRKGGSPAFSNRDTQFNDLAAPGQGIFSLLPLALTASQPACLEQGYSSCGPEEYRSAEGTSFATPQVSAAAAVLFATMPALSGDQVLALLEQSAVDAVPANGCGICTPGRDRFTGAGRLDQTGALDLLAAGVPPRDRHEPNDSGGTHAYPLYGQSRIVDATIDYWNDRDDVYRVYVRAGERLTAALEPGGQAQAGFSLWRPGTTAIGAGSAAAGLVAVRRPGLPLIYRAQATGWYLVDLRMMRPGGGSYRLFVSKTR
jgi:serine protease